MILHINAILGLGEDEEMKVSDSIINCLTAYESTRHQMMQERVLTLFKVLIF